MRFLLQGLALTIPLILNTQVTVQAKTPATIHLSQGPVVRGFFFGRVVNGRPLAQTRSGRPLASGGPPSCQHNSDGTSACVTGAVDSEHAPTPPILVLRPGATRAYPPEHRLRIVPIRRSRRPAP